MRGKAGHHKRFPPLTSRDHAFFINIRGRFVARQK